MMSNGFSQSATNIGSWHRAQLILTSVVSDVFNTFIGNSLRTNKNINKIRIYAINNLNVFVYMQNIEQTGVKYTFSIVCVRALLASV